MQHHHACPTCKTEWRSLESARVFTCDECGQDGCDACLEHFVQCSHVGCKAILHTDCVVAEWNEDPLCREHANPEVPARYREGWKERKVA